MVSRIKMTPTGRKPHGFLSLLLVNTSGQGVLHRSSYRGVEGFKERRGSLIRKGLSSEEIFAPLCKLG